MRLIADTHFHLYPCYDLSFALRTLRENLLKLDEKAVGIGILAEPSGYDFFNDLRENHAKIISSKLEVRKLKNALLICENGFPDLYLFPGHQIITMENIEILCLLMEDKIENGLPAREVIDAAIQNNGVPVISWSPGKWFFKRGKVVEHLINTNNPGTLLIGDTTLRPRCWPLPVLMKKAASKGFTIVCGSDPLPFSGEEQMPGEYAISFDCDFDVNDPAGSLRTFLLQTSFKPVLTGKRGNLFHVINRLVKNAKAKNNK